MIVLLGVAFLGVLGWAAWLWRQLGRVRKLQAGVSAELEHMAAVVKTLPSMVKLEQRALQLDWFLWWVRNAVECPESDHTRNSLIRFALAAALEPSDDFGAHVARLHRLTEDPTTSSSDREAARCFVQEWQAYEQTRELPWISWARTGKPRWNAFQQKRAYEAALCAWNALLPGALSPNALAAGANRSDRH